MHSHSAKHGMVMLKKGVFLYEKITNTKNVSIIEKENLEENKEEKTQQEDELCYNEKKKE